MIFVVGSYTFLTGSTTDDIASMWLNPNPADYGAATAPSTALLLRKEVAALAGVTQAELEALWSIKPVAPQQVAHKPAPQKARRAAPSGLRTLLRCLVMKPELAREVSCPPYDVLNVEEARRMAKAAKAQARQPAGDGAQSAQHGKSLLVLPFADLSPGSWTVSMLPVVVVDNQCRVTVTPLTGNRFFRLGHAN